MTAMTLITIEKKQVKHHLNYSISNNYIVMYIFIPNCTQFITLGTECAQRKGDCLPITQYNDVI